jgi:hypothetical protein
MASTLQTLQGGAGPLSKSQAKATMSEKMNKPTGDFTVYNIENVLCSVCGQPKPHTTWNISIDPTQQLDLEQVNSPCTISRPSGMNVENGISG